MAPLRLLQRTERSAGYAARSSAPLLSSWGSQRDLQKLSSLHRAMVETMRLLVTNSGSQQVYSITRSLRPNAERIVATLSARRPLGFWPAEPPAYSRYIDARYSVPSPEQDWLAGRIQPTNTEAEEAFIARILEICEQENIDTIFPSSDAWVYVFSKNQPLFEARNILVPVPELDTVLTLVDKIRTIRAAAEVGFPCPATHLAESDNEVRRIAGEVAPPWIVKLRFTTGRRGMALINDRDELVERCRAARALHGIPMRSSNVSKNVAMFVDVANLYLVLDRDQRVISATAGRHRRLTRFINGASASERIPFGPISEQAAVLGQHTNWWGGLTVQYKVDPRDGQPKLMEINPRLGESLWYRTELGINEPLMCLQIARGEEVQPVGAATGNCFFMKPFQDLIVLPIEHLTYRFRTAVLKRKEVNPLANVFSEDNRFASYWNDYFGQHERRFDPYFSNFWRDPLPLLVWLSKLFVALVESAVRRMAHRVRFAFHKLDSSPSASSD